MTDEARHHHYIPQCYLRGFAVRERKQHQVNVIDMTNKKAFTTSTRNICSVRDFNRMEIEGVAPDQLEKEIATFEGRAAESIRAVAASKKFEGEDRVYIINMMAALIVRNPQMRENMRDFQERILKMMVGMSLGTKERWESQVAQMKADGHPVREDVTYEQMKEFHDRGEYKIEVAREFHIGIELKSLESVIDALAARKWRLYHTNEETGYFITTDHPVVITWNKPDQVPFFMRDSPGFAMKGTEVIFPLTKGVVLLGRFDGEEGVEEAYQPFVAGCNTRMARFSYDQIYAVKKAFPYFGLAMELYFDKHFLERSLQWKKEIETDRPEIAEGTVQEWSAAGGPPMPKPAIKLKHREAKEWNEQAKFQWPPEPPDR
jgi:hypothetical protein